MIGLAFALLLTFWLGRIHNAPILEVNLTLCIAYLCFFTCESLAGASGILGIVVLGLYMTNKGKTRISVESEEMMHNLWSYIGFAAETAIFLLSGLIMSIELHDFVTWFHVWKLLCLYVILHLIRFCGILLLMPLMNLSGYPLKFNDCIFLAYAGLRGAVGLALALLLQGNDKISKECSELILFYVAGIVILTLFVNGMTAGKVLVKLGLQTESVVDKKLMCEFLEEIEVQT